METLVTGATGFVGRALVAALRARGDRVKALVRAKPRRRGGAVKRLEALGAEVVAGDVEDQGSIERAAEGAEVVFHAAALVDYAAPRARHEAVNLVGTENVLDACRKAGVRRLVHVSTEAVTCGTQARSYVSEDFPQPATFLDPYSETKALAEDLVVAASGSGCETVALRPAWIWGPDDTVNLPYTLRSVRAGRFAWIDGGRSLVATTYVRNLTDALLLAAAAPAAAGRVYYVTDDERVSVRDFLGQLLAAAGAPVPRRSVPFALAWVAAWVAEKTGQRRALNRALVAHMGRSFHFNIQRARNDLGYVPGVSIDEGMKRVRAWAQKVGGVEIIARAEPAETTPES